jgi:long-chain acyl-CoA synthetase
MGPTIVFQGETIAPERFEDHWRRSAAALRAAGVKEGDVVALMMRNSPDALALMWAVRHLGALWCPVNWHFKTDEVQYILRNSGARLLVADAALLQGLQGLQTAGLAVFSSRGTTPGVPAWEAQRDAAQALQGPPAPVRGAMFYTSGTTGRPKGIVRAPSTPAQLALAGQVREMAYGIVPGCARW